VKYLLDSHVVDWAQTDVHRLPAKVQAIIENARRGDLAVSDVTLTELGRHLVARRIGTTLSPEDWLHQALEGIVVLPVSVEIAISAARLDWSHRDPCDRHIVATAVVHQLPLLSIDEKIHALSTVRGLKVIW
jgi:PIN domain nuclease of toxin-antitoxin system